MRQRLRVVGSGPGLDVLLLSSHGVFAELPTLIFRIGAAPRRGEILTAIDVVEFDEAGLEDAER
jgi:hypothetical protein